MMMRRATGRGRGGAHTGHGWFVTFADLMGLLVSFFVMLVAFSTQDTVKLQVVAGSMRDAFGVQDRVRYSGVIELEGLPTRPKLKNAAPIPPEEASANPAPDQFGQLETYGAKLDSNRKFALASASLVAANAGDAPAPLMTAVASTRRPNEGRRNLKPFIISP